MTDATPTTSFHPTFEAALADGWAEVCPPEQDTWFSPPFLRVVEQTLGPESPMQFLVARDAQGEPVAAGVLCTKVVDAAARLPAPLGIPLGWLRAVWPGLLRFRALTLGFPFWGAQAPLRVRPGHGSPELTRALTQALTTRARQQGAWVLVAQDFTEEELATSLPGAGAAGWRVAPSLPDHLWPCGVGDLEAWRARLAPGYQERWDRDLAAFADSGLTLRSLRDPAEALALFDDRVHALHATLDVDASHHYVELTADFFRSLTRRCPEVVRWTVAQDGERVIGFVFSLRTEGAGYQMYLGHEPGYNDRAALYTNLILEDVRAALAEGAHEVRLGTEMRRGRSAADWKADLGCALRERRFLVGSPHGWLRLTMRVYSWLLFPQPYRPAPRKVLEGPAQTPAR